VEWIENSLERLFITKTIFLISLMLKKEDVKKKFNHTLQLISTQDRIPEKFFKHITNSDGIFEVRVEVKSDIFRVFCFFDKGNLVILVNGFQKKTQKTPKAEIKLAEKLKKEYLETKYKKK
jgi:phage-related protein